MNFSYFLFLLMNCYFSYDLINDDFILELPNPKNKTISDVPLKWRKYGFIISKRLNKAFIIKKNCKGLAELINRLFEYDVFMKEHVIISDIRDGTEFKKSHEAVFDSRNNKGVWLPGIGNNTFVFLPKDKCHANNDYEHLEECFSVDGKENLSLLLKNIHFESINEKNVLSDNVLENHNFNITKNNLISSTITGSILLPLASIGVLCFVVFIFLWHIEKKENKSPQKNSLCLIKNSKNIFLFLVVKFFQKIISFIIIFSSKTPLKCFNIIYVKTFIYYLITFFNIERCCKPVETYILRSLL